jgi:hypothetical protein
MSVGKQEIPASARFARWLLEWAVRHWPEETRPWGLALAAEIDETASAFETVSWSLGGIMLFARSELSGAWAWMKLPAGGSLPGASGPQGPSLLPKRSRVFTAAILATAALLLFLPVGREAIRTVRASWQGFQESASDQRTLEELAARAKKEKDAGTLAFVALSTTDPKRAAVLTERAVSLDPELIWVYGARNHRPNFDLRREEWLARLKAADPGNAVPDLLMASALADPRVDMLYAHGTPKDADFEVLADSKWKLLMERAYGAPRYDSYFQKHYQLTRAVWNRERNLPPTFIFSGLWSHAIPDLQNLMSFAKFKMYQARKARAAGDLHRAESLIGEVDVFALRMADGSGTKIEKLIALAISKSANKGLADLFASSARPQDARRVALRLDEIERSVQEMRLGSGPGGRAREQAFRREAILLQGFGILAVLAGLAALAGVLLLEMWPGRMRNAQTRWRRALCWMTDYAPATLLVAIGAFLMSFLPFQHAFAEYRASSYMLLNDERLIDAMWGLLEIPEYVRGVNARVSIWAFVTIALAALLVFVLVRGIYRPRRAASNPA